MQVSIASLRQPTFKSQFSKARKPGQVIDDYLTSELDARIEYLRRKIRIAAKAARADHAGADWLFFGSSRITGKDALDLHEKELAISVTVRHSLDDLYSIVYPFQLAGVHRPANPAHDASPVNF